MGDAISKADGPILGIIEGIPILVEEFTITVDTVSKQNGHSVDLGDHVSAKIISPQSFPTWKKNRIELPDLWLITPEKEIRLVDAFITFHDIRPDEMLEIEVSAVGICSEVR